MAIMRKHPVSRRKTKIVCTIGPACDSDEKLGELMDAGLDVVRINCSHGEPEKRREMIGAIRRVAAAKNVLAPPIMMDLQGPKIRLGKLESEIPLAIGQRIKIESGDFVGTPERVSTVYPSFADDVKVGDHILIDDGKIRLRAEAKDGGLVTCVVEVPGVLKERKGINLPDTEITAPSLSSKDLADLQMAVEEKVDFVAISFVRSPDDVVSAKRQADGFGKHELRFVSKIERPEALKRLIPIINVSDGIMVARGDLGVEIGSHKVPMMQKEMISRANLAGKFVITATQMLESMIERPVPTRAEASDVANAILDGTDACMLSAETASGGYPVEAVKMMERIALETEDHAHYSYRPAPFVKGSVHRIPDGLSIAAYQTANLMGAKLLVAFTNSGGSALSLAKKHPDTQIVGATIHEHIARRMRMYWGVVPLLIERKETIEEMFNEVQRKILSHRICSDGDLAILTSGYPLWTTGSTNLMTILEINAEEP